MRNGREEKWKKGQEGEKKRGMTVHSPRRRYFFKCTKFHLQNFEIFLSLLLLFSFFSCRTFFFLYIHNKSWISHTRHLMVFFSSKDVYVFFIGSCGSGLSFIFYLIGFDRTDSKKKGKKKKRQFEKKKVSERPTHILEF